MSSGRDEMMSKWSDEQRIKELEQVSHNLDDFLSSQSISYQLGVSALNGIVLARLMRLNMEVGNETEFYKMLQYVIDDKDAIKDGVTYQ